MPPDSIRIADTRAWLAKAAQDLRRAEILLAADPPDAEGALYHCQQVAEKALKGFLTWQDVPFRRIHDLDVIGAQCVELDDSLNDLVTRTDALTKYAWLFRYPGAPYLPALEEGQTALLLAREVLNAISSRVPDSARP